MTVFADGACIWRPNGAGKVGLRFVKTPKDMEPLFEKAEAYVERYFEDEKRKPDMGTITIGGQRYVLVRAVSMSVDFLEFIKKQISRR